ncbi:hypothetical protein BDR07DRAFT_1409334 [Suillus spraguei]|nr:hypothetical protein BDR07DRAFT_1409334 [Suillus spraguei]
MQLLLVIHALIVLHPLVLAAHKMSRQIKRILPSLAFIHLVGKDFCRQQNYRCNCKLFSPIQFQNTRMPCNLRKKSWMLNCGHATRRSSNLRMATFWNIAHRCAGCSAMISSHFIRSLRRWSSPLPNCRTISSRRASQCDQSK